MLGPNREEIVSEFAGADLGDARLNRRLEKVVARVAANPAGGFPTVVETVAEREALYRFLANRRVSLENILAPHVRQTAQRCGEAKDVIVAIDGTELAFQGEAARDGLDELTARTQGFEAFAALALTRERVPLGVLAIEPLFGMKGRKSASEWATVAQRAAAALPDAARPVFVMDREADAFELLSALRSSAKAFIVRARYDRLVADGDEGVSDTLRSAVARGPQLFEREVPLSRRSAKGKPPEARRKHPPRAGRMARLAVRACQVVLPCPPKLKRRNDLDAIPVNVVLVSEIDAPAGEQPVDWLLLTNEPIATPDDVARVVDGYRARWRIEEFFKALKTGCGYESRQLESAKTLLSALGLLAPMAWRLLALQCAARSDDEVPATQVFSHVQLKLLRHRSKDVKLGDSPTATEALLALAAIGGHIKSNGSPGWLTLWRGYRKLVEMEAGYHLGRAEM